LEKVRIDPRAALTVFLLAAASGLFGQSAGTRALFPGIGEEGWKRVLSGEIEAREATSASDLRLAPAAPESTSIRAALAGRSAWPVMVESVFLLKIPSGRFDELATLNALSAVSTMSGITYDSYRRGSGTVLFDEVYLVDRPGSFRRQPESPFAVMPPTAGFDVHLKDVNFGSCWYRLDFDSRGEGLRLSLTNSRAMSIFLVRAFDQGALRVEFAILHVPEGILVYGVAAGAPARLASEVVDMYSAVLKRLDSIRGWVLGRLGTAR